MSGLFGAMTSIARMSGGLGRVLGASTSVPQIAGILIPPLVRMAGRLGEDKPGPTKKAEVVGVLRDVIDAMDVFDEPTETYIGELIEATLKFMKARGALKSAAAAARTGEESGEGQTSDVTYDETYAFDPRTDAGMREAFNGDDVAYRLASGRFGVTSAGSPIPHGATRLGTFAEWGS